MNGQSVIIAIRKLLKLVLIGLGLPVPASAGQLITDYVQKMSYYPARVQALQFAAGVMDSSHAVKWGYWTVRFGEATPVATPFKGGRRTDSFEIPLQCDNPELGARECTIEIVETSWGNPVCRITDGERVNLPVECPKSLELAR